MWNLIKAPVISVLLHVLPIDTELKLHINTLLHAILVKQVWDLIKPWLAFHNSVENTIIIKKIERDASTNKQYLSLEQYLINEKNIKAHLQISNNGKRTKYEIQNKEKTILYDDYQKYKLKITTQGQKEEDKCIIIQSLAPKEIIVEYIEQMPTVQHSWEKTQEMSVEYYYVAEKYLEPSIFITHKSLKNTIYSDFINKQFFQDINSFINNADTYNKRGYLYKRGYLLHGPPGTGKTSAVKIIAKEYQMKLFDLNLSVIKSNEHLERIFRDIVDFSTKGEPYIVLLEDFENTQLFKNFENNTIVQSTETDKKEKKEVIVNNTINMNTLLNQIDGINEAYGQILIMTSNDADRITKYKALVRPGRIDKIIEFGTCDLKQVVSMYNLCYDADVSYSNVILRNPNLVSAEVSNVLQSHCHDEKRCFEILFSKKEK